MKGGQRGCLPPRVLARLADTHHVPKRLRGEAGQRALTRTEAPKQPCVRASGSAHITPMQPISRFTERRWGGRGQGVVWLVGGRQGAMEQT